MQTEELNAVTEKIIGAAFHVANTLGTGFLEKVYENAMAHVLTREGLKVQQQVAIDVIFEGVVVGHFVADFLINDTILVELKAIKALEDIHAAQCINYLAATGKPLCLLINFAKRVEVKRFAGKGFQA